jgi:hypothetical protein
VFCHVAHDDWERRRGDVAREGREKRGVTKDHTRRADAGGILVTKLSNLSLGQISIQFSDSIPVTELINSYSQQRSSIRPSQSSPTLALRSSSLLAITNLRPPSRTSSSLPLVQRPQERSVLMSLMPTSILKTAWEVVEHLGYEVVRRFNRENVIMSTNIVAALLTVNRNGVSKDLLAERHSWLVSQITRRGGRVDPIEESNAKIVQYALSLLHRMRSLFPLFLLGSKRNDKHLEELASSFPLIPATSWTSKTKPQPFHVGEIPDPLLLCLLGDPDPKKVMVG